MTVIRDSQAALELGTHNVVPLRVSQTIIEVAHTGITEVPIWANSGGQWKLYRLDVKVTRGETS